jgi:4-aminobutyrate aminotransferase/(S)-3-amino-2-methylpropionate transaminase
MSRHISLRTEVPGPRSREILARMERAVPRTVSLLTPVVADHAHGSLLTDVDGNTFIDFTGGVGVLNVGHTDDHVLAAVEAQARRFLHTDFALIAYEPYVRLAERLTARYPGGVAAKAMFFNSGAEAVENSIKLARAATGRPAVIAFEGAFHGRTLKTSSAVWRPCSRPTWHRRTWPPSS